jgi:hypothetical protein
MKKIKIIILSLFLSGSAHAGSYTPNLNLYKPALGETSYVTPFSDTMDTLDSSIADKREGATETIYADWTFDKYTVFNSSISVNGQVDFNGFKAIALVCDNDIVANMPSSNVSSGQWFYATDIKTLFLYQDSWKPIISFGALTLYVDNVNGSDSVGKGYGSGSNATATITHAIDLIPSINGGDVTINIAGGTSYTEDVSIGNKMFSGDYKIIFQGGALDPFVTSSPIVSATQGDVSNKGTITLQSIIFNNLYKGKLLHIESSGDYRVIQENAYDVVTIVGVFSSLPNGNFEVLEWGSNTTTVTGSFTVNNQKNIVINNMFFNGGNFLAQNGSDVTFNECAFHADDTGDKVQADVHSKIAEYNSYHSVASGVDIRASAMATKFSTYNTFGSMFVHASQRGRAFQTGNFSQIGINEGIYVENYEYGAYIGGFSLLSAFFGYAQWQSLSIGVYITQGSFQRGLIGNTFMECSKDIDWSVDYESSTQISVTGKDSTGANSVLTLKNSSSNPVFDVRTDGDTQIGLDSDSQLSINSKTTTGSNTATITNSPSSGNPVGFLEVTINDATRYIPYW